MFGGHYENPNVHEIGTQMNHHSLSSNLGPSEFYPTPELATPLGQANTSASFPPYESFHSNNNRHHHVYLHNNNGNNATNGVGMTVATIEKPMIPDNLHSSSSSSNSHNSHQNRLLNDWQTETLPSEQLLNSNKKGVKKRTKANDSLTAEEKRRITLEKNRQAGRVFKSLRFLKASRCRKKRKFLMQDLERHAHEVSMMNQTMTAQIQQLQSQLELAKRQLHRYQTTCQCMILEKEPEIAAAAEI